MNALEFLKTVLPDSGVYFLTIFRDGHGAPGHKAYTDLEQMAQAVESYSKSNQLQVYFATSSYKEPVIEREEGGKTKRKYRISENWDRAKAFWVDLDCGESKANAVPPQGYSTQREAAKAIFEFSDAIGWPRPLLVNSGNGVHAYWPLTKAIKSDAWVAVAQRLKSTLKHMGVIADPSRTSDFSSVLRPAGSRNRKDPSDPKKVSVATSKSPVQVSNPAELAANLVRYMKENLVPLIASAPKANDLNSDLTGHLDHPDVPCDAAVMADKCAQVAAMRDTKGEVNYDNWRLIIGLLTYCEDGRTLAEEWSQNRGTERHKATDWDVKFDTWEATGPTKCATLCELDSAKCEGCQFKDKITTPLQLAKVIPINQAIEEEVAEEAEDDGSAVTATVTIPPLPHGYMWDNGLLVRLLPDREGVLQPLPFCQNLFYPTARIRAADGTFRIAIRLHLPDKRVRDFEIPSESVASTTDMLRAMAKYELTKSNHKNSGEHMAAYLLDQLQELKKRVVEVTTVNHFGWTDDHKGFVLGNTMLRKSGLDEKVLLGGVAKQKSSAFESNQGSIVGYAQAINYLYNRKGAEHWQYALCAGWGSILAHYCEANYNGLTLALRGGRSGKGKTTVCQAALAAFGSANDMTIKGAKGATDKAKWATLAVYKNLPILADELTSADPKDISELAYGVANGAERARLKSSGGSVSFAESGLWRLNLYITGNDDFQGILATHQSNSEAEGVRIIQVNVDRYPQLVLADRSDFPPGDDGDKACEAQSALVVAEMVKQINANQGAAGTAMIQYVLDNEVEISGLIADELITFTKAYPDPKYRFYRAHSACTMVIAHVAKQLQVIDFDLKALRKFAIHIVGEMVESVAEVNTITPEDGFNNMINALTPRILVTSEFRDRWDGRGAETPRNKVFGEIAGRYVLGTQNNRKHAGHLILIQKEVRDWCMRNRTDYQVMLDMLRSNGALIKAGEKVVVTRGTDYSAFQQRCIVVDTNKLDVGATLPVLSIVDGAVDAQANAAV